MAQVVLALDDYEEELGDRYVVAALDADDQPFDYDDRILSPKAEQVKLEHVMTPVDLIVRTPGGPSIDPVTNQATQCTIFGIQSVVPYLPTDGNNVWRAALSLILDSWPNEALAARLRQDLDTWDARKTVDWELSLLEVMASHISPSPKLRKIDHMPDSSLAIGDVYSFGNDATGGVDSIKTFKLATRDLLTFDIATNSFALCDDDVVNHTAKESGEWTSFTITQGLGWFGRPKKHKPRRFGIDFYSNLPTQAMQRTLWCNIRHNLGSAQDFHQESLAELEVVISIHLMVRIKWKPIGAQPVGDLVEVEDCDEVECGSGSDSKWDDDSDYDYEQPANNNSFPDEIIYFHRRESSSALPHEFWGFFSCNNDPSADTGLNNCVVKYELEIKTLLMENDMDREVKRQYEERVAGMPGSYHWN